MTIYIVLYTDSTGGKKEFSADGWYCGGTNNLEIIHDKYWKLVQDTNSDDVSWHSIKKFVGNFRLRDINNHSRLTWLEPGDRVEIASMGISEGDFYGH